MVESNKDKMTFEEFFYKKKIDLVQLQSTEPDLFAEFKSHYELMGEKSFDHSKKFWFNKLRRLYHIKEEPKPAKVVIEPNPIASQAEPLSSPESEVKKGFTPSFKAKKIPVSETIVPEENKVSEEPMPVTDTPKPAFKPRFRPQMVKPASAAPLESEQIESEQSAAIEKVEVTNLEPSKPLYKPRFKAPTTISSENIPEIKATEEEQPKPAYKPRFKPQMAKPSEPILEELKIAVNKTEETTIDTPLNSDTNQTSENTVEEEPKTVFKPKFTPRNFKPKSED